MYSNSLELNNSVCNVSINLRNVSVLKKVLNVNYVKFLPSGQTLLQISVIQKL